MAQPDLISQKLMATDPRIGYGEAGVSNFQVPGFDTRGLEFAYQKKAKEAELQNEKEKQMNERLKLYDFKPADHKGQAEIQSAIGNFRASVVQGFYNGTLDPVAVEQSWNNIKQADAVLQEEKRRYDNDLNETIPGYSAAFGQAYDKGKATAYANAIYNGTGVDGYNTIIKTTNQYGSEVEQNTLDPSVNADLWVISAARDEFAKNWHARQVGEIKNSSSVEDGSVTIAIENSTKGLFMMKDKSGRWVPGVSDETVSAFLQGDNGANQNWYRTKGQYTINQSTGQSLALPDIYDAHASQIIADKNNPLYERYKNMDKDQVVASLKNEGDPFLNNKREQDLIREMAKGDLEKINQVATSRDYTESYDEQSFKGGWGINKDMRVGISSGNYNQGGISGTTFEGGTGYTPTVISFDQTQVKPFNLAAPKVWSMSDGQPIKDINLSNGKKITTEQMVSYTKFTPTQVLFRPVYNNGKRQVMSENDVKRDYTAGKTTMQPYLYGTISVNPYDVVPRSPNQTDEDYEKEVNQYKLQLQEQGFTGKEVDRYEMSVFVPYDNNVASQFQANSGISSREIYGAHNQNMNTWLSNQSTPTKTQPTTKAKVSYLK